MTGKTFTENAALFLASAIIVFFAFSAPSGKDTSFSGVLSLVFDDGLESQHSTAYQLMNTYGFRGTLYFIANWSGLFEGRQLMGFAQAMEMQAAGWEIGSHSMTHTNLTTIPLDDVEKELKLSKDTLEANGFRINSFAFPYSKYNDEIISLTKKYYSSSRPSLWGYNNLSATKPYLLKSMWMEKTTKAEDACSWIRQAAKENLWLILVFHGIVQTPENQYDISAEDFRQVLSCASESGIAVRTVSEGLAISSTSSFRPS